MDGRVLLTRDQFREGVFERDNHKCVICGSDSQDAHHILERRLFDDGGYYLDNGASLCGVCHLAAERTDVTCETLRNAIGITKRIIPDQLYKEYQYDKWGNILLPNGTRLQGVLFHDESVQKILGESKCQALLSFSKYIKYPRTYHLPHSPTVNKDDRQLTDTSIFDGKDVVVTIKMDGENTSLYSDRMHARSLDSNNHPSRNWVKNYHSKMMCNIPEGWRVCGENLFAKHSIHYKHIPHYFQCFSIWDEHNVCLSWDDTWEWMQLLDLVSVPVMYKGVFDLDLIHKFFLEVSADAEDEYEGYVVRLADSFHYGDFRRSIAKWVRPNHVQCHGHWIRDAIVPNEVL